MTEWKIQGSRVYSKGEGKSYNCTNKITATELYNTLTQYEQTIQTNNTTENKLDNIEKHIIALQMDLSNVQDTVNKIKEALK
jgi:hypothetical protein